MEIEKFLEETSEHWSIAIENLWNEDTESSSDEDQLLLQ